MRTHPTSPLLVFFRRLLALLLCLPLALTQAASTDDLADIPLANSSTSQIKPNILFILDNSGSMAWGDMPDDGCRDGRDDSASCVGYQNYQCNLMYYNPGLTYPVPLTSGDTNVNSDIPSTFTNALKDGFYSYRSGGSSTRVNLSNAYPDPVNSGLTGNAFYWAYIGPGTRVPRDKVCTYRFQYYWTASTGLCAAITTASGAIYLDGSGNPSIREVSNSPASCSALTSPPAGTTWQLIFKRQSVTSTSGPGNTDERQNFANWYSYYRTRMNSMKSAAGRAFRQVTDKNRVGFITISPNNPVSTDYFLPIADFTSTQKNNWYNKLYAQVGSTSTPLRTALARAGRYYAGKHDGINSGMDDDPVQYSCQQHYAILTTDGYWNSTVGYRLDGTAMSPNSSSSTSCSSGATDNYDGNISELDAYNSGASRQAVSARPIFDGSQVIRSSNTVQYQYQYSPNGGTWGQWCDSSNKRYIQYRTVTTTVNTTYTDSTYTTQVGSPTTVGPTYGDWIAYTACSKNPPALPSPNPGPAPLPDGCAAWPCVTTGPGTNGSCNSLSDVAQYYYKTDLRPSGSTGALGTDVSTNNVIVTPDDQLIKRNMRPDEADKANWQHMTTFTMGMGLSGQLTFDPDYWKRSTTTGHYVDIRNGTRTWPVPVGDSPTALDDLWHAAVNGRGRYFSVADPDSISSAIRSILDQIETSVGASAAAATSSLEPVAGNNFAYTPKYTTREWSGDLEAHQIDLTTGVVDSTYPAWSAQTKLDCLKRSDCDYSQSNLRASTPLDCDNRTIKLFRSGATENLGSSPIVTNMVDFKWSTFSCDSGGTHSNGATAVTTLNDAEKANFSFTDHPGIRLWAQYTSINANNGQRTNATGDALVNYLRGQRKFEKALEGQEGKDNSDATSLFRGRAHVLGDIVDSKPVYVGPPVQSYADNAYGTFKSDNASRTPMIYVGANDGMLHAFYAGTITVDAATNIPTSDALGGQEAWAFIPSAVLPNMYKIADDNYPNAHLYFVDGSPTAADIYDSSNSAWKTVLVGGLNKGGKGYYALDVTNPATPKALWEFKWSSTCYSAATSSTWGSDCHIGYTFGKPVVTKLSDGTWVVLVASGYNNVNSPAITGDGQGYLYVLNALSGQIMYKIGTGVGSSSTPSGLAGIAAWVDNPTTNNTTQRVYGTDLLGNIWRFDVNDSLNTSGREATLVATAKDSAGTAQPITTKPLLASYNSSPYIIVATGKYLGNSDLATTQTQSLYMFLDNLGTTAYTSLRASLRQNSITNSGTGAGTTRTISCSSNCTSSSGWFLDWPDTRERVSTDMQLQLGILLVGSNVPKNDACLTGGYSYLNFFDFGNGLALPSSTGGVVGQYMAASLVVGLNVVRLPNGNTVAIGTTSKGDKVSTTLPTSTSTGTGAPIGTRVSWREIQQ